MSTLRLTNYEALFRSTPNPKILSYATEASNSKEYAKDLTRSICADSLSQINFIARCSCGTISGNFNIGRICPNCGTVVEQSLANDLNYESWLYIPEELPPIMHPSFYRALVDWLGSKNKIPILHSLLNTDLAYPNVLPEVPRGFQNFFMHFDKIMAVLIDYKTNKAKRNQAELEKIQSMKLYLKKWRHLLFTRYLPILNESLHLLTKTGEITYCDHACTFILAAKIELQNLIHRVKYTPINPDAVNTRMFLFFEDYMNYAKSICDTKLFQKHGLIRKNIDAARMNYTYRSVITPYQGNHQSDSITLPWRIGVTLLTPVLIGELERKYSHSPDSAVRRVYEARCEVDPLINDIIKDLIRRSTYGRLPTKFWRNPSLQHGSIDMVFIDGIDDNINCDTTRISNDIISTFNADFDGDCMNGQLIWELAEVPHYMAMHPSTMMVGGDVIGITGDIIPPTEFFLSMNNWMHTRKEIR